MLPGLLGNDRLSGWSDIGWDHAFDGRTPRQALTLQDAAQSFTAQGFTAMGVPLEADSATVQVGLSFAVTSQAIVRLGYGGSFGARVQGHMLNGGVDWRF